MFQANPSPEGRGCREAAGEGYNMKNNFVRYPSPAAHMAMGVPLSLRERDLLETRYNNSCTIILG
jgi:hypothetical protein